MELSLMQMHANLMLVLLHPEVKKWTVLHGESQRDFLANPRKFPMSQVVSKQEALKEAIVKAVASLFNLPDPFEDPQASAIIEAATALATVGLPEWA